MKISSKDRQSQTAKARDLKIWDNDHQPLCVGVTCHVSCVRYQVSVVRSQVSGIRCQVSGVTCPVSLFNNNNAKYKMLFFLLMKFKSDKVVELVGAGLLSTGLPRLVYYVNSFFFQHSNTAIWTCLQAFMVDRNYSDFPLQLYVGRRKWKKV